MSTAKKVISLVAQPFQTSYLCFETGGILDHLHVDLGVHVPGIIFEDMYQQVRSSSVTAGDPSRHQFDAAGIFKLTKNFTLGTLRSEMSKAALDTAINTRQNVYFSKHANSSAVISKINDYYSSASKISKPHLIEELNEIAKEQQLALTEAYREDKRTGVVKTTSSTVNTTTKSDGASMRFSNFTQESRATKPSSNQFPSTLPTIFYGEFGGIIEENRVAPPVTAEGTVPVLTAGYSYEYSPNKSQGSGEQTALNVDYEYRTPYLEFRARDRRAHISILDQKFESFMFEQNIPHLQKIFENELASIDNDVYQFQNVLLRSFLISPIDGIVTGIYKNPGEPVGAGEPVLRIENNAAVRLIASLVHRGRISIGSTATVTTTLFGPSDPATTLTGTVVAARGQGDGDRWEVVVQINNVVDGSEILPLGYCFDREYTDLTFS